MDNEFERIKEILNMYQTNEDKINFLLRQVEMLLNSRDYYKKAVIKQTKD